MFLYHLLLQVSIILATPFHPANRFNTFKLLLGGWERVIINVIQLSGIKCVQRFSATNDKLCIVLPCRLGLGGRKIN